MSSNSSLTMTTATIAWQHNTAQLTTVVQTTARSLQTSVTKSLNLVIVDYLTSTSEHGRNVSDDDPAWSPSVSVERVAVEVVILVVVWLLGVCGNTLVCLVIHRSRRLQSTTNYFVVSLAAADLVLSLIVGPFAAAQELVEAGAGGSGGRPPVFSPPVITCKFVRFVEQLVAGSTSFVFVAISADRFYAIVHPLQFTVTRSRAQRLVLGAWSIAAVVASPCFYFYGSYNSVNDGGNSSGCSRFATESAIADKDDVSLSAAISYVAISTAVLFAAPCVVVGLFYTRVGKYIWRVGINGRTFQRTTNPVQRAKVKMVKMLITLNAVSAALTAPYFVVQLVACSSTLFVAGVDDDPTSNTASDVYAAALWTLFGSAAAKPIVYVTMNANFRRGCKEVMCMSAMRCYRSHAYTITTTSALAKKNHVGVITTQSLSPPTGLSLYGPTTTTRMDTSDLAASQFNGIETPRGQFGFTSGGSWPGPPAGTTNFSTVTADGCGSVVEVSTPDGGSSNRSTSQQRDGSSSTTGNGKKSSQRDNGSRRPTAFDYSEVLQLNSHQHHNAGDYHQGLQQQTISASGSSRMLQGRTATTPYSTYV